LAPEEVDSDIGFRWLPNLGGGLFLNKEYSGNEFISPKA